MTQLSIKKELLLKNRHFEFYITPALEANKPIIFIMHGHGFNVNPSQFKSPNWNVVCPMDPYGFQGLGSWYLGELGNFFWIDAMEEIISSVKKECGAGALYFWGSSMGGYASLLYGYKFNAKAVYANVPQTHLLGSKYSENGMRKYFEYIFGGTKNSLNNLCDVFSKKNRTVLFLCFNQLEGSDYFGEQCLPFVRHLHDIRQKFYLEVRPQDAHGKNHGVSEAINLFKKYG